MAGAKRTRKLHDHELGPLGRGQGGGPSDRDLKWCAWGYLMAARQYADPECTPPTMEYLEALATLRGLRVPSMSEVHVAYEDVVRHEAGGLKLVTI